MDVDQSCRGEQSHVSCAEDGLGIVSCEGGTKQHEQDGEDGRSEKGSQGEGEKSGLMVLVSIVTSFRDFGVVHTINLAKRPASLLFPECCFRRYPGFPGFNVTETPADERVAFFLSSSEGLVSVGMVPAGGRQSMT